MTSSIFCHHCGLPVPAGIEIEDRYAGSSVSFCCHGCHGAFLIISGAGLDRFYRQRQWNESGLPENVYETDFADAVLASYVITRNDGHSEISILVDGIRCATCVWLLEKTLQDESGVVDFRVNYGSHRARIVFDSAVTTPENLCRKISRLGYLPRPFNRNAAHEAAAREQKTLLIRFGTAAFLSMQLMGYSLALYAGYFQGIDPDIRQMIQYFAAAVTTPVVFYSGWPFLAGAWRSLVNRAPSMDLLIALGVLTAYAYSLFAMIRGGEVYFDTAAMIVTLILLGRLFENSARNRSVYGIDRLLQLAPDTARLEVGTATRSVRSDDLNPGDRIVVLPGERVPVDSRVVSGESEFDESPVTGEALPVNRGQGDDIASGSLNLTTSITLEVVRVKADSFIARINRLVEEAQNRKAPVQALADRVAAVFIPIVILVAAATFISWYTGPDGQVDAALKAVAVLVVACPCALGLATPTAVLVATGRAAAHGILFRGGDILERTSRATMVAFDKTGTLTAGRPVITAINPATGIKTKQLLELAARVADGSTHPLSAAISDLARKENVTVVAAPEIETVPGRGLVSTSGSERILLGSALFLTENGIDAPAQSEAPETEVHLAVDGRYCGMFRFNDRLRAEAKNSINELQGLGLETALLTGDRERPTLEIIAETGIRLYRTDMTPAEKAEWLERKQHAGHVVIMVGDGINDAPALARADVGCALAGGTDIALETSDLVLTRPDLDRIAPAVGLAGQSLRTIRQNLFWAFSYNLVAIPLAAGGLLAPIWAAAAMASSSVLVIGNSLRLGRTIEKNLANANWRY